MTIRFPSTDEPFSVSAQSAGDAVTISPTSPSGCDVTGSDPRAVTVVCNDATNEDPVYEIMSQEELVDITLAF